MIRRALRNGMDQVHPTPGFLGGIVPLFMQAQTDLEHHTFVELTSQTSPNRPTETAGYEGLATGDIELANDGLFEGTGSVHAVAALARALIVSDATRSVEAQAGRLTWGSLNLL